MMSYTMERKLLIFTNLNWRSVHALPRLSTPMGGAFTNVSPAPLTLQRAAFDTLHMLPAYVQPYYLHKDM